MNKENKLIPGLPTGFEDRWNKKLSLKKKLIKIIENNFIKYGFDPLETPSFEITIFLISELVLDTQEAFVHKYFFVGFSPTLLG